MGRNILIPSKSNDTDKGRAPRFTSASRGEQRPQPRSAHLLGSAVSHRLPACGARMWSRRRRKIRDRPLHNTCAANRGTGPVIDQPCCRPDFSECWDRSPEYVGTGTRCPGMCACTSKIYAMLHFFRRGEGPMWTIWTHRGTLPSSFETRLAH
jgi:hypothetical protein